MHDTDTQAVMVQRHRGTAVNMHMKPDSEVFLPTYRCISTDTASNRSRYSQQLNAAAECKAAPHCHWPTDRHEGLIQGV